MHLNNVTIHPESFPVRDHYPFNLPVFYDPPVVEFDGPVTMFVGENGTGKSTLLEAIAHACNIYIWRDEEEIRYDDNPYETFFHRYVTPEWSAGPTVGSFFGAGIFHHFARALDDWARADPGQLKYFGGRSLVTQSHGQSLMSYFRNCYKVPGLHLLDEPEAALSPRTQIQFLKLIRETSRSCNAQFIIATHSPIILSCPGAVIYRFGDEKLERTPYEETDHYRLYRDFMENRDRFLSEEPSRSGRL